MADIDVQRKGGMGWLWWILGLLLLALIIWWLASGDDEADEAAIVEPAPVVTPATTPEPIAQGPLCVAQVLAAPTTYIGQSLGECEMRVVEVISDRGFWVEENGQRVFVVINEASQATTGAADVEGQQAEQPDINVGQTVRVSEAVVLDNVANLAGPLDQQTQNVAQSQPWFLAIDAENVGGLTQSGGR